MHDAATRGSIPCGDAQLRMDFAALNAENLSLRADVAALKSTNDLASRRSSGETSTGGPLAYQGTIGQVTSLHDFGPCNHRIYYQVEEAERAP